MTKRKLDAMQSVDIDTVVAKFDIFVKAFSDLLQATPEEDFSVEGLKSDAEDRAVIAKVLKQMHIKGKLSWMGQYLKDEETPVDPCPPHPFETAPSNDPAFSKLDFATVAAKVPPSDPGSDLPTLPTIYNSVLLNRAFTHRSYATACAPAKSSKAFLTGLHNERLEFLGDSFLNHSVTKMLFIQLPEAREGEMSLLRAELIGNTTAAEFGRRYGFDKQLLLNDTAERDGVRKTPKVIADTFEAYLGALVLDGTDGNVRADTWLKALMAPRIKEYLANKNDEPIDPFAKQRVWNHFQSLNPATTTPRGQGAPMQVFNIRYDWVDGGGGNDGGFIVAAKLTDPMRDVKDLEIGRGFGLRKKEAEHRAAMNAAKRLSLQSQ